MHPSKITAIQKLSGFTLFIGVMFLVAGIFFSYIPFYLRFYGELLQTEVIAVNQELTENDDGDDYYIYQPTFLFNYQGNSIKKESYNWSTSYNYPIGSMQEVYYSPKLDKIMPNEFAELSVFIFPLIGFILCITGGIGFRKYLKWSSMVKKLKEQGNLITRPFIGLQEGGAHKKDKNETPYVYVLVSRASKCTPLSSNILEILPENSEKFPKENVFFSEPILFTAIAHYNDETVLKVYVDPIEPENYYVDLRSAQQKTKECIVTSNKEFLIDKLEIIEV